MNHHKNTYILLDESDLSILRKLTKTKWLKLKLSTTQSEPQPSSLEQRIKVDELKINK